MPREIIPAEPRSTRGKNESRRLRSRGLIPAVVYGAYKEAFAVSVDPRQITKILHSKSGHNTIFDIGINGGETTPAMIVDWQYNPVRDTLLHVDLKRIDLTRRIKVSVPIATQGEPKGVKVQGGLLEVVTREVEIECLPDEIPERFTVDVSELVIGESIRVSQLPMEGSIHLVSSGDNVIAHIVSIREEEVAPAAAPAEAAPAAAPGAEPEVIKKGKKEEEGGEPEAKGKKK